MSDTQLEDQLRHNCYELHAARSEVADLMNKQRDVECRFEYLRTVLRNMERAEAQLSRTLAYETSTTEAVLHAAATGQPLPPALAADAATSVLCPPVHLGRGSRELFQSGTDVERRQADERRQLLKEIGDMEAVVAAERRSIGTLQHAMYAQAAWGDSVVMQRRRANMTHNELCAETANTQAETRTHAAAEETLRRRMADSQRELEAKGRLLEEVQGAGRILGLQVEELRAAVVAGRRDLLRARTLESECQQVAEVARDKVQSIGRRAAASAAGTGGGEVLAHAAGQMFVAALGGSQGLVSSQAGAAAAAAVTGPTAGASRFGASRVQQPHRNNSNTPQLFADQPHPVGGVASGSTRYQQSVNMTATNNANANASAAAAGWSNHNNNNNNNNNNATASPPYPAASAAHAAAAAAATAPTFAWTGTGDSRNSNNNGAIDGADAASRQASTAARIAQAQADSNEWLRRYVGSMRGLHLTALETVYA